MVHGLSSAHRGKGAWRGYSALYVTLAHAAEGLEQQRSLLDAVDRVARERAPPAPHTAHRLSTQQCAEGPREGARCAWAVQTVCGRGGFVTGMADELGLPDVCSIS